MFLFQSRAITDQIESKIVVLRKESARSVSPTALHCVRERFTEGLWLEFTQPGSQAPLCERVCRIRYPLYSERRIGCPDDRGT
jgi:hypothetical protein